MQNTPAIKVLVDRAYITNHENKSKSKIAAYMLAVDCRPYDRIRFTCLLQSGAIWSGLPIEALWCDRFGSIDVNQEKLTPELQPYTCLEGPYSVYQYEAIKHASLNLKDLGQAYYLFSINYTGQGFAECPEQSKTHNIVVLESGQLGAFPNNYIVLQEPWFTEDSDTSQYRRDSQFYFPAG